MNRQSPKLFFLIFSSMAASIAASPLTSHDDLVHDLAHYGAGTLVAETLHFFLRKSTLGPWQKFSTEVVAAAAMTILYECATEKSPGIGTERTVFGTLGAAALGLQVDFKWRSGKRKP